VHAVPVESEVVAVAEISAVPEIVGPIALPEISASALPPSVTGPDPRRRLRLAIAAGVVLLGALTLLTVALSRSPEPSSPPEVVASRTRSPEPAASREVDPPAPAPTVSAAEEPEVVPDPSPKPNERRPDRAPRVAPEPTTGKKPYRPRGI
jgi:hypothetical protein